MKVPGGTTTPLLNLRFHLKSLLCFNRLKIYLTLYSLTSLGLLSIVPEFSPSVVPVSVSLPLKLEG